MISIKQILKQFFNKIFGKSAPKLAQAVSNDTENLKWNTDNEFQQLFSGFTFDNELLNLALEYKKQQERIYNKKEELKILNDEINFFNASN